MKRTVKSLIGFSMGAIDGEIGTVKEFFFDDETWTIRYLIVQTGNWLAGRKVLISPEALVRPDWEAKTLPVNLTIEQIKKSPNIDTDKPVSRQQEMDLHSYYPWSTYWGGGLWGTGIGTTGMMTGSLIPMEAAVSQSVNANGSEAKGDPHLRSTNEVKGYTIRANDGEMGEVEDFILDDQTWKIDFLEVDTGNWLPGKKVLLSPEWIKAIDWAHSSVVVNVSIDQVKNSPEYSPDAPIDEGYYASLHTHYQNR